MLQHVTTTLFRFDLWSSPSLPSSCILQHGCWHIDRFGGVLKDHPQRVASRTRVATVVVDGSRHQAMPRVADRAVAVVSWLSIGGINGPKWAVHISWIIIESWIIWIPRRQKQRKPLFESFRMENGQTYSIYFTIFLYPKISWNDVLNGWGRQW